MKNCAFLFLWFIILNSQILGQDTTVFIPKQHSIIKSDREDQRFVSSRGVVHALLKNNKPKYSFNVNFSKGQMKNWQEDMRKAMANLMKHPQIENIPEPKFLSVELRDGYKVEKWEAYPLPECAVPYLVLIPDNVSRDHPVPAVLCIPGSGQSKESMANESKLSPKFGINLPNKERYSAAIHFVKKGLIAIAVDNPAVAEASDLEKYTTAPHYNYDAVARCLLELNWSYLGYSSYIDMHILNWMKRHPLIDKKKLIVCGFSLGTEPLMALGVMDPSIYAFIYNDFLCRTLERMIVMTEPNDQGIRPFPNSIRHLIPGFLTNFDFPDIVCSLAPRYVICTEGGLDRDLNIVKKAYSIMGVPENVEIYHYPKFADRPRGQFDYLPEGINRDVYFALTNVDPPNHDMKMKLIMPWLNKILNVNK